MICPHRHHEGPQDLCGLLDSNLTAQARRSYCFLSFANRYRDCPHYQCHRAEIAEAKLAERDKQIKRAWKLLECKDALITALRDLLTAYRLGNHTHADKALINLQRATDKLAAIVDEEKEKTDG